MRLLAFATLFLTTSCALFRPVTTARRVLDLPPRPEPCEVTFLANPDPAAQLVGELAIDSTYPGPEHWQDDVRRSSCELGGDSVWVSPLTERRDEWTYCGGRDSVCRDRFLIRYLGTALVYRAPAAP